MWPLITTHSYTTTKIIRAPPDTVLKVLHEPNVFFRLNPLVISVTPTPHSPSEYTIVDELPLVGSYKAKTTYTCISTFLEDGLATDVVAAAGTRTKGVFYARKGLEEGTSEIVHQVTVQGLFFLLPYIRKVQQDAHEVILDQLRSMLEGKSGDHLPKRRKVPGTVSVYLLATLLTICFAVFGVAISVILGMLSLIYLTSRRGADPYGLFHLYLNKLPDDKSGVPPSTEWLNVGYWKDIDVLPSACRALALKLNQAAKMRQGDRVLDVGHGTGESLIFLLCDTSIPRPSSIVGITSLAVHHQRSRDRIARLQNPRTRVVLYLGDAVYGPSSTQHPLAPESPEVFDCVFALDCAYHFHTRKDFLSQSLAKLAAGGKVALADMCFDPRHQWLVWLSRVSSSIPTENIVSMEEYVELMKNIGFVNVEIEDITRDVFPNFLAFLKGMGTGWWMFSSIYGWYLSGMGAKFVIVVGQRSEYDYNKNSQEQFRYSQADLPSPQMTAIQAISIRGYEERSTPKPHIVYRIEIQAHVRSWQMWRRYSEFDDLHIDLTRSTGSSPPCTLPPKHKFSLLRSHDTKILEERKVGLEKYLRAILSAKDDKWRENFAFRDFLGVPVGKTSTLGGSIGGESRGQFTLASWLGEHMELQARIRDVRADINKRDALADRGDISASHRANVSAKAKLAGVLARIGNLGEGLRELGMHGLAEGELQRRTDMVARLQDDCEKLGKMVTVARQTSKLSAGLTASGRSAASESDREALLSSSSPSKAFKKSATRVFGASQPKETEVTRPLDEQGLLSLQQTQIQQQDNQLAQLTTILQRQRHLGEAINSEVASQIEMLDDLNNEVDKVGSKLTTVSRQMNRLG
ncbi:hypothetical protein AX17_000022 [Amanita inopinata Kibby_2008]|nr:hypothetical protein AX17_000022 [Amanita inopinata Kibby_2008]